MAAILQALNQLPAIARRLPSDPAEAAALADDIERVLAHARLVAADCAAGDVRLLLDLAQGPDPLARIYRECGMGFGDPEQVRPARALVARLVLARDLGLLLDHVERVRRMPDPDAWLSAAWPAMPASPVPNGMDRLTRMLTADHPRGVARQVLLGRALVAELRGGAPPPDPFAPGDPLRTIRRDGRLAGAYSVGPDGHDDGGDRALDVVLFFEPPAPPPPAAK